MAKEGETGQSPKKPLNWKLTVFVCVIIALVAVGLTVLIKSTEPSAQREGASKKTAMLVEVLEVEQGNFRPQIVVMGLVRARDDVMLSPRVSGEIIERSSNFTSGAQVRKGEMLVKIDPADYEIQVAQRESALHQAEADLAIEMGRQNVAKLDYELLDKDIVTGNENLVLRKPQLNAAKADVEAAQAMLDQAKLELERTTLRAPFDAQVLSRNVAVGSQVSPGDDLGRLVSTSRYWVTATAPLTKLPYIDFASQSEGEGSLAKIRNRTSWPTGVYREGRVDKLIGALDEGTRLARINVGVEDPLALTEANAGKPPLIIGSLLEVTIEGREIENVVRLDRAYLREDDTVWVMQDGTLNILPVVVEFRDADYVYISEGLPGDAKVVTTSLSSVVDGAPLRTQNNAGGATAQ
ncbi:efflux RND transporter periplasmic adaptor subunit [Cerasicoccus fimbriatus]|uniref:efflux RND transporter periplasmic adaptor subunit n=1 Tax=Cerasicoccus fimbriatus TaxID=3014554 RepID=UPI0022B3E440|nr:efflux RND transporter periplasmic adaptor subunit [Cerasicoccus sp. TK19100]